MRLRAGAIPVSMAALLALVGQDAPREQVGPLPTGGFLLESGWRIRPAGRQVALDTFPMAAALSPDGRYLLVLNAGYNPPSISVLDPAAARELGRVPVPDAWLGLAFSLKGDRVYAGGGSQAAVFEFSFSAGRLELARTFPVVPPEKRTPRDFIGDVALSPGGRLLYAADLYNDSIAVINPQSGRVIERFKTGRRPYRILFHPDGKSFFVSSWTDGAVLHHEAENGSLLARVRLGPHPTDMLWGPGVPPSEGGRPAMPRRLFVAAANTNTVYSIGVSETKELRLLESIDVSMTPRQPAGMTPSALALGPDSQRLFVVCSDANALAVTDVSPPRSHVLGFIPTGWYPTAARALPDGRLVVLNGRGLRSSTDPGSAQFVDPFSDDVLKAYTATVLQNSPYRDEKLLDAGTAKDSPVPARPGDPSPIHHVVYIVQEANADLDRLTPNRHKLAREFVLLDSFYANSGPGAEGLQWSVAAIASDYVRKLAPASDARRGRLLDYEGQEPTAVPPAGYLWTNAAAAGLSVRKYGDYPGSERAGVFLEDLARFEKSGEMPRLILIRLGNGAGGDHALGLIVEALSRSRFWPRMAIFVLEFHSQNGDSHRSPAFVISPFVRRHAVDRTMYNTSSMLRTIELILGLRPMTHFDAGARPMDSVFQPLPDLAPYAAEKSPGP